MQGAYKQNAVEGFKSFPSKKRIHRMIPRMVPRRAQSKWQLKAALFGVALLSCVALISSTCGFSGVHHRRLPGFTVFQKGVAHEKSVPSLLNSNKETVDRQENAMKAAKVKMQIDNLTQKAIGELDGIANTIKAQPLKKKDNGIILEQWYTKNLQSLQALVQTKYVEDATEFQECLEESKWKIMEALQEKNLKEVFEAFFNKETESESEEDSDEQFRRNIRNLLREKTKKVQALRRLDVVLRKYDITQHIHRQMKQLHWNTRDAFMKKRQKLVQEIEHWRSGVRGCEKVNLDSEEVQEIKKDAEKKEKEIMKRFPSQRITKQTVNDVVKEIIEAFKYENFWSEHSNAGEDIAQPVSRQSNAPEIKKPVPAKQSPTHNKGTSRAMIPIGAAVYSEPGSETMAEYIRRKRQERRKKEAATKQAEKKTLGKRKSQTAAEAALETKPKTELPTNLKNLKRKIEIAAAVSKKAVNAKKSKTRPGRARKVGKVRVRNVRKAPRRRSNPPQPRSRSNSPKP